MNYIIEPEINQRSVEQRIIMSLPYLSRSSEKLSFNQKLLHTLYFTIAYLTLVNTPLFAIQPLNALQRTRFSLTGFKQLNILSVAKSCSFVASVFTAICFKQQIIIITAGKRRAEIIKAKFRFATYAMVVMISSYFKIKQIFNLKSVNLWIYPKWGLWFKIFTYLELVTGALLFFFLQQYCELWGIGQSLRLSHVIDYGQSLLEWLASARYIELEAGFNFFQVLTYSLSFLFVTSWLYNICYVLPLQSAVSKSVVYEHPIKFMLSDTQAIYLSAIGKETAFKFLSFLKDYFSAPINSSILEFLDSDEPYHHNYIYNKNWLTAANLIYNAFCYVFLVYLWAIITDSGAGSLAKSFTNANFCVPGYRKDTESIQKAIQPQLDLLMIVSSIINFLLVSIGNIMPLFGNINAQNLLIMVTLIIELREYIKKEQQRFKKTGEKLSPVIKFILCI